MEAPVSPGEELAPKADPDKDAPAPRPAAPKPTDVPKGSLTQKEIYQTGVRNTVLLVATDSAGKWVSSGSGFVVDRERRVILTNHHVVAGHTRMLVLFPELRDGKLISEREHYIQKATPIAGEVFVNDSEKDLAAVIVDRLPDTAVAAKLADDRPTPGDLMHSVGNPRGAGMWVYSTGTVRQVYDTKMTLPGGQRVSATVIETQSPVNPGDSGGPVLDDQARVVGVVSAYNADARLSSIFIELTELQKFLIAVNELHEPKNAQIFTRRGDQYATRGEYGRAATDYSSAIQADPGFALAYAGRANCFMKQGDATTAMFDFDEAIKLDPHCEQAFSGRALAYAELNKLDDAVRDATQLIRLKVNSPEGYFLRGLLHKDRKDWKAAVIDLDHAAKTASTNPVYWYHLGDARQRGGDLSGAINEFIQAIKANNNYVPAYTRLGEALLYGRHDCARAIVVFSDALKLDPQNAVALAERGRAHFLMDQMQMALQDFNAAVKLTPQNPMIYDFRGDIFYARREFATALEDYQQALKIDGQNPMFHLDVGNALAGLGRLPQAIESYDQAIALNPKIALAYVQRAIVHYRNDERSKSQADMKKAAELDPTLASKELNVRKVRYLRVTNATSEAMDVSIHFHAPGTDGGWHWYPNEPETDTLVVRIPAHQTGYINNHTGEKARITGDLVRIWGNVVNSQRSVEDYRTKDLRIAPEKGYLGIDLETFDYTFTE